MTVLSYYMMQNPEVRLASGFIVHIRLLDQFGWIKITGMCVRWTTSSATLPFTKR